MRTFVMAAGAGLLTFAWAKFTKIGPVVFTISEKHGLGVHSGDLMILTLLTGVVAYIAVTAARS